MPVCSVSVAGKGHLRVREKWFRIKLHTIACDRVRVLIAKPKCALFDQLVTLRRPLSLSLCAPALLKPD
jgi:hypothetical protein